MLEQIKFWVLLIPCVLCLVLFAFCISYKGERDTALMHNMELENKISDQNSMIAKMAEEEIIRQRKVRHYEKLAQQKIKLSQQEAAQIWAMVVPTGCEEAFKWMAISTGD